MYKVFCDICSKGISNPGDIREVSWHWGLKDNEGHTTEGVVDKDCLKILNAFLQEKMAGVKIAKDV